MEFSISKGTPTSEELIAIEAAMAVHKREEFVPIIRRSSFGAPQLRKPLIGSFQFNLRKN